MLQEPRRVPPSADGGRGSNRVFRRRVRRKTHFPGRKCASESECAQRPASPRKNACIFEKRVEVFRHAEAGLLTQTRFFSRRRGGGVPVPARGPAPPGAPGWRAVHSGNTSAWSCAGRPASPRPLPGRPPEGPAGKRSAPAPATRPAGPAAYPSPSGQIPPD